MAGVKFRGALSGVPGYDVIRDTFPDNMHLLWNMFQHLIQTTWLYNPGVEKSKGVNIEPLPPFVARDKQAGESDQDYDAAIQRDKAAYQAQANAVRACRDMYALFGLDENARYEVCRRFKSIRALPRQIGTGSPYKNFGTFNIASAHFFLQYCSWIYDDVPGGPAPAQLEIIKKMFSLAKLVSRKSLPCHVDRGLGDYIVRQVHNTSIWALKLQRYINFSFHASIENPSHALKIQCMH